MNDEPDPPDDPTTAPGPLRLATPAEIEWTIAAVLQGIDTHPRRKGRVSALDQAGAGALAARIIEHLRRSRFVILKRPPVRMHSAPPRRP